MSAYRRFNRGSRSLVSFTFISFLLWHFPHFDGCKLHLLFDVWFYCSKQQLLIVLAVQRPFQIQQPQPIQRISMMLHWIIRIIAMAVWTPWLNLVNKQPSNMMSCNRMATNTNMNYPRQWMVMVTVLPIAHHNQNIFDFPMCPIVRNSSMSSWFFSIRWLQRQCNFCICIVPFGGYLNQIPVKQWYVLHPNVLFLFIPFAHNLNPSTSHACINIDTHL